MKKSLPIGINTFETIIKEKFIYVDKTQYVYELISKTSRYFLSRPRRFGKSLLVDTLKSVFEAKKELFQGLYIYDKWDWNTKFPVIKIDFVGNQFYEPTQLQNSSRKPPQNTI
ncbi:MAG: hypothetical protein KatS3mg035_0575 [Bacteroidia bacterium]|nr:MAG: hypothetical protein KatS3mg035_0575 [Bacteroidia bacterium]